MKTNKNLEQMGDSVEIKHRIVKEGMGKPTGELGSLVFSPFLQQIGTVLSIGLYRRAEYFITLSNPVKKYK